MGKRLKPPEPPKEPGAPVIPLKKGRRTKNESLVLDVDLSVGDQAEIERRRQRWRSDLTNFSEERLMCVDRDAPGGAAIVPLKFSPSQWYLHNLIEEIGAFNVERSTDHHRRDKTVPVSAYPIKTICLKARKVRWSTYFSARRFWRNEFNRGHTALVMAHERDAARNIAQIEQRFHTSWYLRGGLPERTDIVRCSDDLIEWKDDSRTVVKTAGVKSGSAAGYTFHYLHFSEAGRFVDGEEVAVASTAAAAYHENHVESTAHGLGWFKEEWDKAMWLSDAKRLYHNNELPPADWNGRYRAFWAWWQEAEYALPLNDWAKQRILKTITETELDGIKEYNWSLEQIAWRRSMIAGPCSAQTEMEPEDFFKQEYPSNPGEAFISKGFGVFPRAPLEIMYKTSEVLYAAINAGGRPNGVPHFKGRLLKDKSEESGFKMVESSTFAGSSLVLWYPPERGASYVQGGDTAEGLEQGDDSVTSVFDRTDGTLLREAARLVGKFGPDELAEIMFWLHKLYNESYVVCERSGIGAATCIGLVRLGCYNMHHSRNVELFKDRESPESFTAGFDTKGKSKQIVIGEGVRALREMRLILHSQTAITQWMEYSNIDGKLKAPTGKKDDCVMSDCLAIYGHNEAPFERGVIVGKRPAMTNEELQNDYWKSRVKSIMKSAHERNALEERFRRTKEIDWSDVFN